MSGTGGAGRWRGARPEILALRSELAAQREDADALRAELAGLRADFANLIHATGKDALRTQARHTIAPSRPSFAELCSVERPKHLTPAERAAEEQMAAAAAAAAAARVAQKDAETKLRLARKSAASKSWGAIPQGGAYSF